MRKSRFSEEQIVGILNEVKAGATVRWTCAKHNISEQSYYGWKRRYGGMEVDEVRQMRALAEENSRLKRLVADQAVQIQILKEVNAKKW
jgi:putative transposase